MKNNVHFIGIGGAGTSALARLTKDLGFLVSGSDIKKSPLTELLKGEGIAFFQGHRTSNLPESTALTVYSSAVDDKNPEILASHATGIPCIERSEFLGRMLNLFKRPVAVSGTHGKSTTSAMLLSVLLTQGLSPTCLIGANAPHTAFGYARGTDDILIAEACEYRDAFLRLSPFSGIILNIEYEHPDYFSSLTQEITSFQAFVKEINPKGFLLLNRATDEKYKISPSAPCRSYTFGLSSQSTKAHFYPRNLREEKGFFKFDFMYGNLSLGQVSLSVAGLHNVENALAAGGCAFLLGASPEAICQGLSSFSGVSRRLEYKGKYKGAHIYDDYAHHPTEIASSLTAIKKMTEKHIICLFQPHTYSRTYALFNAFVSSLSLADEILIAPIYGAREKPTEAIASINLSDSLRALGKKASNFSNFYEIQEYLKKSLTPDDVLIVMGAGNIYQVLNALK